MKLAEILQKIEQSCIYCVYYNNTILGFRVKAYNLGTDSFDYFDFTKEMIADNQSIREYINNNYKSFSKVVVKSFNNVLASDDEINGKIVVREIKDDNEAKQIIARLIKVLRG